MDYNKSIYELLSYRHNTVEEQRLEMFHSLLLSIKEVGGQIDKEDLLKMSVADLIDILAQNGVRFCVKQA